MRLTEVADDVCGRCGGLSREGSGGLSQRWKWWVEPEKEVMG